MSYPFFLSYARADRDDHLDRFARDLSDMVSRLSPRRVGPGYRDLQSNTAGHPWREEVVEALTSSAVLVFLESPRFYESDACGKEVQVFLERRKLFKSRHGGREPGCLIPVRWQDHPPKLTGIPECEWAKGLAGGIRENGQPVTCVYELMLTGMKVPYDLFVYDLAKRISALQPTRDSDGLPPLAFQPQFEGVPSAFDAPIPLTDSRMATAVGPDAVTFVYASPPAPRAWPFHPTADSAIARATLIAKSRDKELQAIEFNPPDPSLVDRVKTVRQRNNTVVVLIDGSRLGEAALCKTLGELDDSFDAIKDGVATVVVWNREPDEARAAEVLRRFSRTEFFYGAVNSPDVLDKAVARSLAGLYNRLLQPPPDAMPGGRAEPPIPNPTPFASAPGFS